MILTHLKHAHQGWYAGPIAYALGVSRDSIYQWFSRQRIPKRHRAALRAYALRTADAFMKAAQNIEIDNSPPRKRGMYEVKDHGDGLPPHNSTSNTLRALGLTPQAKLGKAITQAKRKPAEAG